jgi:putative nucleotidyltransferase with HDIG domain
MLLRSLRAKLVVFWVAFAALLVLITNLIAFRTALDAQFKQLQQTLLAIASTSALSVDGDLHRQIPLQGWSTNLPAYQALAAQLRAIRDTNPGIRYVYTMAPSGTPGRWHYVVDAEERRPSLPGEPYDVTRYPAMAAGLAGPSVDPALTVDEWGVLLSGYAPIKDRTGSAVGIVGIDMSGEQVFRTQAALRHWRLAVLAVGLLTALLLGLLIAQWISRPLNDLVQGTQRIGQGDLRYRVPVRSQDEVGVLAESFNRMAGRLSETLEQLRDHVISTLQALAKALEAKDRYTRGHSARVQHYAVKIAQQLRLAGDDVELVREMSLLHDVGKIGVKEEILNKPATLTPEEFEEIKRHPEIGYRILEPLRLQKKALEVVRHHHERLNGEGYPMGLKGGQIPLVVGIVTAVDCFDAMTGHRPYRPTPKTFPEAVEEMRRCSGTQFMPVVVEALVEVLRQEGRLP